MDAVKYTPGPWMLNIGTLKGGHILVYAEGYGVAKVYDEETESRTTNMANARLIAAAPDLLEALQDALGALEQDYDIGKDANDSDWEGLAYQRLQNARAAIAKALGQ